MRTSARFIALLAALLLGASACGDGDTATEAADDTNAQDDTADTGDDGGSGGDGTGRLVWEGEEYTYDRVVCETIVDDLYQIRASGADEPQFQVRFPSEGDGHDFENPQLVGIFFNLGETIGDGEGYELRGEDITNVTSDGSQVSGELHLEPDDDTMAPETNPEGGTAEFEMTCP